MGVVQLAGWVCLAVLGFLRDILRMVVFIPFPRHVSWSGGDGVGEGGGVLINAGF